MIIVNKQSLISLLAGMMADPTALIDVDVTAITMDSRQVEQGGLFVSLATQAQQAQDYLQQAVELGVAIVLFDAEQGLSSQHKNLLQNSNIAAYGIKQLADKAGEIAARFYGHPSMALTVIAVTGTNGKTSVSQFIAQALESLSKPCAVMGTLGFGRLEHLTTTGMTTPNPIRVQAILAGFCQQKLQYVVIEASSHALQQGRLNSVDIDVAILTNLSRDHLDYHHTMADYAAAKQRLFEFASVKTVIINADDDFGQQLITTLQQTTNLNLVSYSQQQAADIVAQNSQVTRAGVQFDLVTADHAATINSVLLGGFNIDNLLATSACLLALDIHFDVMAEALSNCQAVNGRMQVYGDKDHPQIVIDFAHSPDALSQALITLRTHISNHGLVWCVFGCGGDRDVGKRSQMGQSAEHSADRIVLTNDNPRSEDPVEIVKAILAGITQQDQVHIEYDRNVAIHYAVSSASKDDVVLVAGKGHEQYQEIAGIQQPFSDQVAVQNALGLLQGEIA